MVTCDDASKGGLLQALANPLRAMILRATLRIWPHQMVRGFLVTDFSTVGTPLGDLHKKLDEALALIELHDARRFARLRRDVRRMILVDVSGPEYVHPVRGCMLRAGYVLETSREHLALTIVHEGTHARLWAAGFDYAIPRRARIEGICVREEAHFAEKLPDGGQLADEAREKLSDEWWSEESVYLRRLRQLNELRKPRWYIRLYELMSDPR